jgi:hypothetical protein
VDHLRLAYGALALGLMGFGAIWIWGGSGLRRPARRLPGVARWTAVLLLLLAAGGTAAVIVLEGAAARPW